MKRVLASVAAAIGMGTTVFGATLTWDANTGVSGVQSGGGTWNTANLNWWNGSTNVAWNNANLDTALFDHTYQSGWFDYTATLGADVTVGAIGRGYSSGNMVTLAPDAGGLYKITIDPPTKSGPYQATIAPERPLTIDAPIMLKGYNQDFRYTFTINGNISDDGGARVLYHNFGTLTLNGNNSFTGGFQLQNGTVVAGSNTALDTGTFTWGSGYTLQAGGGDRVLNNAIGNGWNTAMVFGGHYDATFTPPQTFYTGPFSARMTVQVIETDAVLTMSSATTYPGYPGGFSKTGAGTLAFGSFTPSTAGAVDVQAGTLLANGPFAAAGSHSLGALTVNAGATLGGTGSISVPSGQAVTVNAGGTLAPGASAGTLTVSSGNVVVSSGGRLFLEFAGTGAGQFDVLTVTSGALNLSAAGDIMDVTILAPYYSKIGDSFRIITAASVTNTFDLLRWQGGAAGGIYSVAYDATGATLTFNVSIPEPATAGLLALAGVLALRRRRV